LFLFAKVAVSSIFAGMKRIFLYILFFLIIADSTSFHQFFKLPVLFQHFAEHQERNRNVDMIDFLSMHYWGQDIDDDDDERDRELPFKKLDTNSFQLLYFPSHKILNDQSCSKSVALAYPVYRHNHNPNPALSSLFKPPCA